MGREVLHHEHALLELPARCGGLALANPVSYATANYAASKCATAVLQEVVQGLPADMTSHSLHCKSTLDEFAASEKIKQLPLKTLVLLYQLCHNAEFTAL